MPALANFFDGATQAFVAARQWQDQMALEGRRLAMEEDWKKKQYEIQLRNQTSDDTWRSGQLTLEQQKLAELQRMNDINSRYEDRRVTVAEKSQTADETYKNNALRQDQTQWDDKVMLENDKNFLTMLEMDDKQRYQQGQLDIARTNAETDRDYYSTRAAIERQEASQREDVQLRDMVNSWMPKDRTMSPGEVEAVLRRNKSALMGYGAKGWDTASTMLAGSMYDKDGKLPVGKMPNTNYPWALDAAEDWEKREPSGVLGDNKKDVPLRDLYELNINERVRLGKYEEAAELADEYRRKVASRKRTRDAESGKTQQDQIDQRFGGPNPGSTPLQTQPQDDKWLLGKRRSVGRAPWER